MSEQRDIVDDLRQADKVTREILGDECDMAGQAADEITRLRALLDEATEALNELLRSVDDVGAMTGVEPQLVAVGKIRATLSRIRGEAK
ncbi:MAG: hypothetical protein NUW01_16765 [Gemmatimonadaceae bacterium]|nr:hypothetical protein [Gemmatimonadaceae bacterium]